MLTSPTHLYISLFGFHIYYYGVVLAVSIAIGVILADKIASKYFNFEKDMIIDSAPYVILAGIVGARLYYCLLNYQFFVRFPTEILALRHGGISIHGAFLGGVLILFLYSKIKKISFLQLCDIYAFVLPLSQAIGRWGNYFNSEAFGLPTNLPWKLYIAEQYRPIPYKNNEYFHPTFLYESLFNIFIFLIFILFREKLLKLKAGNLTLLYLILYSTIRIFTENLRLDSTVYIGNYSIALVVSIVIIILSGILLIINNMILKKNKEL